MIAFGYLYRSALGGAILFAALARPLPAGCQAIPGEALPDAASVSAQLSTVAGDSAKHGPDGCRVRRVTSLPGSHHFASDFVEAMASAPDASAETLWGLTADLSAETPARDRAIYISKSVDGGATWTQVVRLGPRYFDARLGEGLRNGLSVAPGGTQFVVTTQRGAFQVFPQVNGSLPVVKAIAGPRVPSTRPKVVIAKKAGDPRRANVVGMTGDGRHLVVGYGYFDLDPVLFSYRLSGDGSWVESGQLPRLPTAMDLLSLQFDDPRKPDPDYLYLGTGDQAYILDRHAGRWSRVDGVGPDSAIHGMSIVRGPHLAACWGIYNPIGRGAVKRVTSARFLLHRNTDQAGPNLRAYSIDVDSSNPARQVVTSLTGVYASEDGGETWRRLNDLPEEEFRSAHINADGSVLVSGIAGTFLVEPFSQACSPHLKTRNY